MELLVGSFSSQHFMSVHWLLADEKSAVNHIVIPQWVTFFPAFKFFLFLWVSAVRLWYIFLWCFLCFVLFFDIGWASWVCSLIFFIKLGKFSAINSSIIFSDSPFSLPHPLFCSFPCLTHRAKDFQLPNHHPELHLFPLAAKLLVFIASTM